jgi:hypothetical protein
MVLLRLADNIPFLEDIVISSMINLTTLELLVEVYGNEFQMDFKELEKSDKGLINYAKPLRRLQPVARKCRNTTLISRLQVQVLPSLPLRSDALYRFRNGKVAVESPKSHHLIRLAAF